jgi:hypothetical protein
MKHTILKYWQFTWLSMLLIFPLVLWILPQDFFDNGDTKLCLSVILFNRECYGCGLTRGVMHFHHFNYTDAIYFNPLVIIVYPLLVYLWYIWLRSAISKVRLQN